MLGIVACFCVPRRVEMVASLLWCSIVACPMTSKPIATQHRKGYTLRNSKTKNGCGKLTHEHEGCQIMMCHNLQYVASSYSTTTIFWWVIYMLVCFVPRVVWPLATRRRLLLWPCFKRAECWMLLPHIRCIASSGWLRPLS